MQLLQKQGKFYKIPESLVWDSISTRISHVQGEFTLTSKLFPLDRLWRRRVGWAHKHAHSGTGKQKEVSGCWGASKNTTCSYGSSRTKKNLWEEQWTLSPSALSLLSSVSGIGIDAKVSCPGRGNRDRRHRSSVMQTSCWKLRVEQEHRATASCTVGLH